MFLHLEGGLDANLVAALMNNNNKSLDPATVALLRDNDKGLETAALANGGGMFGGAAMWNNPFMYLVWMWMMRWMNGNGDTEIYLRRDDLETKLKSQVDSYRIMFESVNKQKQLYEKYNDLFQSVKGNSQENVTEEKYKELIARIAELEEQLKEKEQPKE